MFRRGNSGSPTVTVLPAGSWPHFVAPSTSTTSVTLPRLRRSKTSLEVFGTLLDYDRTVSTADTSCPINEQTILWLDGAATDGPYTHYVKQRAPWKNSLMFAVKQVEVSNGASNHTP